MSDTQAKLATLVPKFEAEIRGYVGPLSSTPSGFEKRDCMLCHLRGHSPDRRGRFGIMFSHDSISIHCFNCGYKAHWRHGDQFSKSFHKFLTEIGMNSNKVSQWQFKFFAATQRMGLGGKETNPLFDEDEMEDVFPFNILNKWKPLEDNDLVLLSDLQSQKKTFRMKKVFEYVKERELENYMDQLAFSESQPDRLIIPFYHRDDIVGYTGRHIKGHRPKYLDKYSSNDVSQSYLYNYHNCLVSRDEYVIITDGILDALHTRGIASMRTDMNSKQVSLINHLAERKKVILVPDFDNAGFDFCDYASENGWLISIPHWDDALKDVDEMVGKYGRLLTIYAIVKNANKDYITVKSRAEFMRTKTKKKNKQ